MAKAAVMGSLPSSAMISALLSDRMVQVQGEAKFELDENMRLIDWDPTRMARTASGKEANPKRRATSGD